MRICIDLRTGSGCGAANPNTARVCGTCGQPLKYALELHDPGDSIGHYRVRSLIGCGSFGAVYAAEDTRQQRQVALKESFESASIQAFRGEFAVLKTLEHDHLPRYYEMFEADGNGYLVMELIPGQSLEDVLNQQPNQPLAETQVLGYALQLCNVLTYLHSRQPMVLHRDIKPANIRLTPSGLVKLVDFGLLKQGTATTRSSRRGLTAAYAPLEQWGSTNQGTTPQSDLYSLAASLYHLFTGQLPIPVNERVAANSDPLKPAQQHNRKLSAHISAALMQAMAIKPEARYASVAAFQQVLVSNPAGPTVQLPQPQPTPACKT
ncbi:MAG: protein kinase, partial [Chloroflexaceae bacterium]|nr:protein kinase [Chloroflexaceae bacterium]